MQISDNGSSGQAVLEAIIPCSRRRIEELTSRLMLAIYCCVPSNFDFIFISLTNTGDVVISISVHAYLVLFLSAAAAILVLFREVEGKRCSTI